MSRDTAMANKEHDVLTFRCHENVERTLLGKQARLVPTGTCHWIC